MWSCLFECLFNGLLTFQHPLVRGPLEDLVDQFFFKDREQIHLHLKNNYDVPITLAKTLQ